jgi:hypothetical protein
MKTTITIIILVLSSVSLLAEIPQSLKMRIQQMGGAKNGLGTKLIKEWPKEAPWLFQGLRKDTSFKIKNKKDHLKAISKIPKHLLNERVVGATIEHDGWFYTSIEHKDWNVKEATWFNVIASSVKSNMLYFSYSW